MKKVRFLVTCCLVFCLVLGGCAKEEPPLEAPAGADASPEMPAEAEERAEEAEAPIEATEEPTEEVQASEPHGIIAMVMTHGNTSVCDILCIDPDSGAVSLMKSFRIINNDEYAYMVASQYSHYANCQEIFSPDFSKIAVTQVNKETGENHAGWYDDSGEFFDVTLAMNPGAQSSFSETIKQNGIGFTSDGGFIYNIGEGITSPPYYLVSMDGLSSGIVQEYEWADNITDSTAVVTDWMGNNCYLVDVENSAHKKDTSKIYDNVSQTFTDYIPDNQRANWGGVISPDGQKVAFLSTKSSSTNIELFATSPSGGEPALIDMSPTINDLYDDVWPAEIAFSTTWCTLLDWR